MPQSTKSIAPLRLTIGNSLSKLEGLTREQHASLRQVLSYSVDSKARFYGNAFAGGRRYLISSKGEFPTGLLRYVDEWKVDNQVSIVTTDSRIRPRSLPGTFSLSLPVIPYSEQQEALEEALATYTGGTLSIPTGCGKSVLIAMLINSLQVKTLVVVPNIELKRQLSESFKEWFGVNNNLTVENIDSPSLETATGYDCLIIDEAHHSAARTYRRLNLKQWKGIFYRYFFTATAFRSRSEENILMESVTGKVVYKLEYPDAVKRGLIVPVEAYYYELPKIKCKGTTWPQVYQELIVKRDDRNELISCVLASLFADNKSTLCLVKEVEHGSELQLRKWFPFAHGQHEERELFVKGFTTGKLTCLIGTTGVLGEGVDTKPAEYVIIAGLGKSKNQFLQQVGRGVRRYPGKESCKVVLFQDKSHKWTKQHFSEQVKILQEYYGVTPIKLEI